MIASLETEFEFHNDRFRACVDTTARLEVLYSGTRFGEGPAYFPAHRMMMWSDIPSDRILRFDEASEQVSVFRSPSRYANGNARDFEGRLVTCEQGSRRVVRTEHSGVLTVLAAGYQGSRLNSPNDVTISPDGSVWFSDPTYGIDNDYEGNRGESEIGASNLYRVDPLGNVLLASGGFVQPNGLAFSGDYSVLYVVDSGFTHGADGPRHIRRFEVTADMSLKGGEVFAECDRGVFDGIRVDRDDRVWASTGDGVRCIDSEGIALGTIHLPEVVGNVEFGGPKRNDLYLCGAHSLYRVRVGVNGARVD